LKTYPAIDVARAGDVERLLAAVDDFAPTAAEERGASLRVFFPTASARDQARAALDTSCEVSSIDVPDEDWARRSQEGLQPVTVGNITVFPTAGSRAPGPLAIVIAPSMGFGTGHHATTRLCLAAMQAAGVHDALAGARVLDLGTGSGVLAIAADLLGASGVLGIDHDPDAIRSARENLPLNPAATHVDFAIAELTSRELPDAGVETAKLTGAQHVRTAPSVVARVRRGGVLVMSGLLAHEREEVVRAFLPASVVWDREEDGWVGLVVRPGGGD
jgi:ribosomal protein L11 methyltransferase